jgi:hypothetical protein
MVKDPGFIRGGYSLKIERATGALSAALADAEGGLVVAGACVTD